MKITVKKLKEILKEINDNISYCIYCNTLYDTKYSDDSEIDIMEIIYRSDNRAIKITNIDEEELFAASVTTVISDDRSHNINILDKIIKTNIPGFIKCEDYIGAIHYVDLINYYDDITYYDIMSCTMYSDYIYFSYRGYVFYYVYYDDIKWDVADDGHENHMIILRSIKNAIDNKDYDTDDERVKSRVDDAIDKMNKLPDSIKVLLEI